ncbi:CBS-domain-containing protein [Fomitiporia mediterranea MF3/22]|uniref:CBS-domain-containing protein n=1 Tax=Fomitiporia mediterranea (strain MF3/22) TaxID=694068 RepID=UPI00044073C5|nr:CBS-domain-containing protein [Fomitiporia mediterranea MF3/22]EJD04329.1 CBS-domain-containing protein [Fomitiporia mediterranea MF3/22]
MSSVSFSGSASDTRKKQAKRDEAIRKKIESDLARKRTISLNNTQSRPSGRKKPSAPKGSVAALKPSPALTVPEGITVSDASQLCAAKRTDCVLVVDEEEGLSGIFTAKDLAYRVTAEGLDPRSTPVSAIMTRNPMVTRDTTSATEALQLMVTRHFRHLPVCNEEGNVVGLLDITKVFHEALDKVERSSSASEKLYHALTGVQTELGPNMSANPQAAAMLAYVDALREKTALPDLTSVMDSRTHPATVSPKTTVKEAAKLMKENRTTAVCVMENTGVPGAPPRIAGIFTSKDIVLRVIAAGLEPSRCSVVRVMTPHPDTAAPTMIVQDALKKMYNGHYLNLPVVEADGRLVAIVDVLKLTYATLEQMDQMAAETGVDNSGGPMWGRFFESIGHDDNDSAISGSNVPTDIHSPPPYPDSPMRHLAQTPEVGPNDSASVVDDDHDHGVGGFSGAGVGEPAPVDDGTYVFKFSTPSKRTHRFQARYDDVEHLREIIIGKLQMDPYFTSSTTTSSASPAAAAGGDGSASAAQATENAPKTEDFQMYYKDADGDDVYISHSEDLSDAVKIARRAGVDRVVLFLHGGSSWVLPKPAQPEPTPAPVITATPKGEATIAPASELSASAVPSVDTKQSETSKTTSASVPGGADDGVLGIPRDLLLPASIGALAVAIIAVFTISRLSD